MAAGVGRARRRGGWRPGSRQFFARSVAVFVAVWMLARPGWNQSPTASAPVAPNKPYVLHVYEDLVQVPALVLTADHETEQGLSAHAFDVQLDGGPKFHPRAVRTEGDDPLSFSLLLDARYGEHQDLVQGMAAALERMPTALFQPHDRISVFAYKCALVGSVMNAPASVPGLKQAIVSALHAPGLQGEQEGGKVRCRKPVHLWDAMEAVVGQVRSFPGRQVLLVVSDGQDFGSETTPDTVRLTASGIGLAIFGLHPKLPPRPVLELGMVSNLFMETAMNEPLGAVCGGSGGLLIGSTRREAGEDIARVLSLVRGRYILEFSRPHQAVAGMHSIDVSVADASAVVRASGVTVAMQDPTQWNDPNTVHGDTSHDPVLGRGPRTH